MYLYEHKRVHIYIYICRFKYIQNVCTYTYVYMYNYFFTLAQDFVTIKTLFRSATDVTSEITAFAATASENIRRLLLVNNRLIVAQEFILEKEKIHFDF
jgi:hypothetical protein